MMFHRFFSFLVKFSWNVGFTRFIAHGLEHACGQLAQPARPKGLSTNACDLLSTHA